MLSSPGTLLLASDVAELTASACTRWACWMSRAPDPAGGSLSLAKPASGLLTLPCILLLSLELLLGLVARSGASDSPSPVALGSGFAASEPGSMSSSEPGSEAVVPLLPALAELGIAAAAAAAVCRGSGACSADLLTASVPPWLLGWGPAL